MAMPTMWWQSHKSGKIWIAGGTNEICNAELSRAAKQRSAYPIGCGKSTGSNESGKKFEDKRVGFVMSAICPVYPKRQTLPGPVGTSLLCHKRK